MFGGASGRVSSTDMTTIIELSFPRTSRVLRLLFFPTHADITAGYLNTKLLEIKPEYKDCPTIDMEKAIELKVHGQTHAYRTRRNGFLVKVKDSEYCEIFKMLNTHANTPCPTWNHWMTLNKNVAEPLRKIMKHVMLWYSRSWKYPAARDNDLKTFNWSTEIEKVLFRNAQFPEDTQVPWEDKDLMEVSEKLLESIWKMVLEEDHFREPALKSLVGSLILTQVGMRVDTNGQKTEQRPPVGTFEVLRCKRF
jgi:hypothetical protein